MSSVERVNMSDIRIDGGTQPRVEINLQIVAEYAEAMTNGDTLPPVVIFHDGATYWLADGFHRYFAAKKIDAKQLDAKVVEGTKRDATLYSVGANAEHGARRTNEDKRKAVLTLLNDPEWAQWSNREIARRCRVDHVTVGNVRSSLVKITSDPDPQTRRTRTKHGTETTMNTSRIGKTKGGKATKKTTRSRLKPATPVRMGFPPAESTTLSLPRDPYNMARALLSSFPHDVLLKMSEIMMELIRNERME